MRNIGESRIYIVPELSADNEQWVNPEFGNPNLQTHYDNIKRMVKEKTGRAMQEKERERKGKNGKIIKVAGCSPIREGVLLIKPDTTLADVKKFGEECQKCWGITPLQIFLHKDEGHWLNGQPDVEDKESFQVGEKWFKPNYHAHIVFDWMNHDTGKSQKLNDDDMMQMQTLASDILLMERGQSKAVTGKEHLERNDFIIEKQKAELQRMDAAKRHKEEQINLAEQELRPAQIPSKASELKAAMNNALKDEWVENRGISVEKIALNPITLTDEDMKKINEMEDAASIGSNPFMMAGRMTNATADAMQTAAGNSAGAMTGFMGMGMVGMGGQGGFGAAQNLYNMGAQQQAASAPAAPAADSWKCSCGATVTGKFCPECGAKKPEPVQADAWKCSCGANVTGKFCPECGSPKPAADNGWTCACGAVNKGKFCQNCGAKKPEGAPLYRCDKCGWEPEDPHNPPKFCPECGDPFDDNDKQ